MCKKKNNAKKKTGKAKKKRETGSAKNIAINEKKICCAKICLVTDAKISCIMFS